MSGRPVVAVVAHARKKLGGGLPELRKILAQDADIIFAWGGDGMVQRCADALAGQKAALAIVPAGTANLLASNLGIPADLAAAVQTGLHGARRWLDTGSVNGEHFAVMAGAGFDARMISGADRKMKARLGRAAYLYSGARSLAGGRAKAVIDVDGQRFFRGRVSSVLVGNVGTILGGLDVFSGAQPDDGHLELGVVTARNPADWARVGARIVAGQPGRSPFVQVTSGKKIRVRFDRPFPYELDGGARGTASKLRVKVHPASLRVCVPASD